ncbi:PREDICTED: uncharacterized protein LOC108515149 isoform X3 [Rhinopithecus bieti]|uniref:uncharacterized protein LOC108515149 isoform X3 n=1 Tax=Rhinopithecus bieti TaxID=61621 RepID=UPI00083BD0EE|nr:PREDICTED: uncharacterized protein LOC108515149 isoform X3 [Rhinopithecus bieti]
MMHQASKGIFTGIPHSQIPSLQGGHQPSPIFFLLFLLLSSFLCFYVFLSIRFFSFDEVPPATALSPRKTWTNFAVLVALARTVSVEQLPGGSSGVFAEIGKRFWQCPEKDGSKTQRGTFHMLWESPWSEEARAAFTRPRDQPSLLDLFFLKRQCCGA